MSTKSSYMDYVQVGIKVVSLLVLYAIYIKVDELYQMKSDKEGYRFNTAKARQQPRQQTKEKFSVMNPEMDQCMAACKANEWSVEGTDITPEGQCELLCSGYVNYSANSPCFKDMSDYPSL
jgi:hypothetical protein